MPDREKVIKCLEACTGVTDDCAGHTCPYWDFDDSVADWGCRIQMEKDALELLKEQEKQKFFVDESRKITPLPVVVRCEDCKHRGDRNKCIVAFVAEKQEMPYFFYDNRGEWFCADGRRREDE